MYALNSRALALLALASCLALTVPASAQITFSVGSDVVDISQDKGNESDPSIAINYLSPSSLFVISATDNATQGLVTARSANYGVSWTANIIATNTGTNLVPAFGLPSAAFDSYGNLFVAYLPASEEGVAVIVSTNGGSTFTALTNLAAFDSTDTPRITAPAGGVAAGTVWVVYKDYSMVGTPLVAQGLQSTNLGTNGVFGPVQILPISGGAAFQTSRPVRPGRSWWLIKAISSVRTLRLFTFLLTRMPFRPTRWEATFFLGPTFSLRSRPCPTQSGASPTSPRRALALG